MTHENGKKNFSCCVPHCQTIGAASMFLGFPVDPYLRQKWISAIPKDDWVVDHTSLICSKHFQPGEVGLNSNQNIISVSTNCVPSIFCSPPEDIKDFQNRYFPSYMFEVKERDFGPETFGELANEVDETEDFLINFYFFKENYEEKLNNFLDYWNVTFSEEYAFFYVLSLGQEAKIKCSIKISQNFVVEIVLGGRKIDPLDVTKWLPVTSKLTRWSQLKMLLIQFGSSSEKITDTVYGVNLYHR